MRDGISNTLDNWLEKASMLGEKGRAVCQLFFMYALTESGY